MEQDATEWWLMRIVDGSYRILYEDCIPDLEDKVNECLESPGHPWRVQGSIQIERTGQNTWYYQVMIQDCPFYEPGEVPE